MYYRTVSALRECKKFSIILLLLLVMLLSSTLVAACSGNCNGVGNCSCNGDGTCDGGSIPFTRQQAHNTVPGGSGLATTSDMIIIHVSGDNLSRDIRIRDISLRK